MQRSRGIKVLAAVAAFGLLAAACGSDDDDGGADTTTAGGTDDGGDALSRDASFTLFGAPTGVEGEALSGFIDVYNETTGSDIQFTGSDDFESQLRIRVDGGDPPAVAFTPQPSTICSFADEGALVSLEEMGFDIAADEGGPLGVLDGPR
jgi:alpha-glucoside transport system substrate-binding protein